jgi:hypothetical protein
MESGFEKLGQTLGLYSCLTRNYVSAKSSRAFSTAQRTTQRQVRVTFANALGDFTALELIAVMQVSLVF